MFDKIKASLLGFASFTDGALEEICSRLKHIHVPKDGFLMKDKQVSREFYFINNGAFRQYTVNENEEEVISNLYLESDWMLDYKALMTGAKPRMVIQATEDSDVFELSALDFHELIKMSDMFFQMGRIFEMAIQNQDYQNTRLSPEEKYMMLLQNKPQVIQRFPLKYIASYLGITAETLSRVRRKIIS